MTPFGWAFKRAECAHTLGALAVVRPSPAKSWHRAHVTSGLERDKHTKHAAAANNNNMRYVTWAGTTYGGWGDEWAHLRPEYAKRLAAEKKAGGSGWDTIKWKQNLYETMNIEIARSNYAMLMERTLPPMAA